MIRLQTNIYRRRHRNGTESWMVRWKDPKTGRWISRTAGKSRDEALLVEAQVRQDIGQGKIPTGAGEQARADETVAEAISFFFDHSRFLKGTPRWQKEVRAKLNLDVIPRLGKK